MDIHLGTAAKDVPVDFYAGAVAAFVVIVFAKFATHAHPRKHKTSKRFLLWILGARGHAWCIWLAWFGLMFALMMLGRLLLQFEVAARVVVGVLVCIAGAILSFDTSMQRTVPDQGVMPGGSGDHRMSPSRVETPPRGEPRVNQMPATTSGDAGASWTNSRSRNRP